MDVENYTNGGKKTICRIASFIRIYLYKKPQKV